MHRLPLNLLADGLRLAAGLYLPAGAGPHPALIVCHGIPPGPRDPSDRGYQELAETCCRAGFATLIFNFRGVGLSEGNLDLAGWTRDLRSALEYVLSRVDTDAGRVNLLGFSAGAAVSLCVAADDLRVTALASCACPAEFRFLSTVEKASAFAAHLREIGLIRDPGFPPFLEDWMAGFRSVRPLDCVVRISPRPLLLVHGDRDDLVPVQSAHMLYERAGEPKALRIIKGAGHRLRREPEALAIALDWLKTVNRLG